MNTHRAQILVELILLMTADTRVLNHTECFRHASKMRFIHILAAKQLQVSGFFTSIQGDKSQTVCISRAATIIQTPLLCIKIEKICARLILSLREYSETCIKKEEAIADHMRVIYNSDIGNVCV